MNRSKFYFLFSLFVPTLVSGFLLFGFFYPLYAEANICIQTGQNDNSSQAVELGTGWQCAPDGGGESPWAAFSDSRSIEALNIGFYPVCVKGGQNDNNDTIIESETAWVCATDGTESGWATYVNSRSLEAVKVKNNASGGEVCVKVGQNDNNDGIIESETAWQCAGAGQESPWAFYTNSRSLEAAKIKFTPAAPTQKYSCNSSFQCVESASGTDLATCQNTCNPPTKKYSCSGSACVPNPNGPFTTSNCNNQCQSQNGNVYAFVKLNGVIQENPGGGCITSYSINGSFNGPGSYDQSFSCLPRWFANSPVGLYTFAYTSGGPPNATFTGIDGNNQTLASNGNITAYYNFTSAPPPTCTINGQTNGQMSVRVGDHFVIPWSNSSGLRTLTGSGWSGPMTCSPLDDPACARLHISGGLPACPPESGKCSWGGHDGSYLYFQTPGTSAVTLTATNQAGQTGQCSYSVTATDVPPATGTVEVRGIVDNQERPFSVNYNVNGPSSANGTSVHQTFTNRNAGTYSLSGISGFPSNFIFDNWDCDPSNCVLNAGQTLFLRMRFHTSTVNQFPTGTHDTNDNAACNAQGWTTDPDNRNIDLTVNIYSDGSLVKTDTASRFRSDLQSAGVCPEGPGNPGGTCAFVTSLSGAISPGVSHSIRVRALDAQTGQEQSLGETPKSITCSAAPINGACGSANGVLSANPPTANLCSQGTPTGVTDSGSSWIWQCQGSGGGSTASCSAPKIVTASCDTSFPNGTFHACYFDGTNPPTGANPVLAQNNESTIDHDWGFGQVNATGKNDQVSGIWRGRINFAAGKYIFHTFSDDGVTLNLEGFGDIITNWTNHAPTQNNSSELTLSAGERNVTLRWYENGGGARVKLWWDFSAITSNNASCLGITAPTTVTAGQSFSASVAMRNIGTKTWTTDATPHRLGSQNPQDNTRWRDGRVALPNNVAPNTDITFNFNNTAPLASGSYPFDWKMVEDGVEWFGATCQKTITVNPSGVNCDTSYPSDQFHACYFDGTNPPAGANPVLAQNNESVIDHDWGGGQVNATGKSDQISGIWRSRINFPAGNYVFHTLSDDGVMLNLEGFGDVISNWTDHGLTQNDSAQITLPAGLRNVTLKWYENGGGARVKLWWDTTGGSLSGFCEASPNPITQGDSTVWTAFISGGTAPYTYSWSGTDGLTGSGMNVGWIYNSSGTKNATVAVTDSVGSGQSFSCASLVVTSGGGCINECSSGASQCTDNTHVQTCGNFDADSCLEWGPTPPNSCNQSEQCISGSCAALPPNPPASFSASAGPACNVVNFFWTDTNSPPADSFTISCNSGAITISGLTNSSHTFTGAEGNTTYNCAITAVRSGLSSSARPLNTGNVITPKCPDFGLNYFGELAVILSTAGTPKDTNTTTIEITNAGTSFTGEVNLSFVSVSGGTSAFTVVPHFGATTLSPGQTTTLYVTVSGAQPIGTYNGFVNIKGLAPALGIEHTIGVPLKVEVKSPGFIET